MALNCTKCDHVYEEGTKFCPECGEKTPEQRAAESFPEQAKHYVGQAAEELWGAAKDAAWTGKDLANKDAAKKMAGGATIGAAAALVAPISIAAGAAIGAGIVAYRHLNKKNEKKKDD
ncbi:hypothetical protein ACFOWX_09060 [Sphingorhabdus arenilitoris]|uniref:Zinc ribbon domain-containing protein n=1 Tax=Sphingorhabdus arenilitoris TaxID=1490041 RepID=A0ABV8RH29_9SPHN